jgi:hypothetical protein
VWVALSRVEPAALRDDACRAVFGAGYARAMRRALPAILPHLLSAEALGAFVVVVVCVAISGSDGYVGPPSGPDCACDGRQRTARPTCDQQRPCTDALHPALRLTRTLSFSFSQYVLAVLLWDNSARGLSQLQALTQTELPELVGACHVDLFTELLMRAGQAGTDSTYAVGVLRKVAAMCGEDSLTSALARRFLPLMDCICHSVVCRGTMCWSVAQVRRSLASLRRAARSRKALARSTRFVWLFFSLGVLTGLFLFAPHLVGVASWPASGHLHRQGCCSPACMNPNLLLFVSLAS